MSLAGARLLARRCPAYRRREPGLRHSWGTGEGAPGHCRTSCGGREGVPSGRSREELSTLGVRPADRLVVVVKAL